MRCRSEVMTCLLITLSLLKRSLPGEPLLNLTDGKTVYQVQGSTLPELHPRRPGYLETRHETHLGVEEFVFKPEEYELILS
ncbi:MAG: hypothetical protein LWW99_10920 [Deltaproteobacteria bacterium]|nr:hypothetical protein [Deltaproteobacteria bacterium]